MEEILLQEKFLLTENVQSATSGFFHSLHNLDGAKTKLTQ